jgi:Fe-Mn family superoxide dismutase
MNTFDAATPLFSMSKNSFLPQSTNFYPLLALNMWEHAYLMDHKLDKDSFINHFWNFVNWARVDSLARNKQ